MKLPRMENFLVNQVQEYIEPYGLKLLHDSAYDTDHSYYILELETFTKAGSLLLIKRNPQRFDIAMSISVDDGLERTYDYSFSKDAPSIFKSFLQSLISDLELFSNKSEIH